MNPDNAQIKAKYLSGQIRNRPYTYTENNMEIYSFRDINGAWRKFGGLKGIFKDENFGKIQLTSP